MHRVTTSPRARRRALLICAEDTAEAAAACEWAIGNLYREGDVVHMTYVVKCLLPHTEIFHGVVGGSYNCNPSNDMQHEQQLISDAKARLEARYLPLLRPKMVPYQLHLYAEQRDAGLKQVAALLMQDIEQRDADIVILSTHNKTGTYEALGSVAEYLSKNCRRPLTFVRPAAARTEESCEWPEES